MAYHQIQGHTPTHGSNNSPFGDTTYTKVFVGGLAWETQSETMRRYFEQFGDILEAVVITDRNTGRSKGYGFVSTIHIQCPSIISHAFSLELVIIACVSLFELNCLACCG